MKKPKLTQLIGVVVLIAIVFAVFALSQPQAVSASPAWQADEENYHADLKALEGEFGSASEVTEACLECHQTAGEDILMTTHWNWTYETEDGQAVGKANVINNYCIATASNEARCTSCHIGYGYRDAESFDFDDPTKIDCLVCHDSTQTYVKFPTAAGEPAYEETVFSGNGKTYPAVDLNLVAQNVAMPTRENCAACHFYGGGGAGVKHGDLDPSMTNPTYELDVHMSPDGEDFTCQTCHITEDHNVSGSRYEMTVGQPGEILQTCESCHQDAPHEDDKINQHTDTVACQTCHIPEYAREFQTKTWWDWSTAGQKNDEGKPFQIKDESTGWTTYDSKKGDFVWEMNVVPEYMWFNGDSTWITLDDTVVEGEYTPINALHGDKNDPGALIYPIKPFYAIQPYDAGTSTLAIPHLFPNASDAENPTAYWKAWDWAKSLDTGQASVGREFSGEVGFIETVMYWPLTHMVAPAENAVACESCHTAENGRLDFAALGYTPDEVDRLTTYPTLTEEELAAAEAEAVAAAADATAQAEAAAEAEANNAAEQAAADEVSNNSDEAEAEPEPAQTNLIWGGAILLLVIGVVIYLNTRKKAV